jgi:hypothetical protein
MFLCCSFAPDILVYSCEDFGFCWKPFDALDPIDRLIAGIITPAEFWAETKPQREMVMRIMSEAHELGSELERLKLEFVDPPAA